MKYIVIIFMMISLNTFGQQFEKVAFSKEDITNSKSLLFNESRSYQNARWKKNYNEYNDLKSIPRSGMAPIIMPLIFFVMGTSFTIAEGLNSSGAIIGYGGFIVTGAHVYIKYNKHKRHRK